MVKPAADFELAMALVQSPMPKWQDQKDLRNLQSKPESLQNHAIYKLRGSRSYALLVWLVFKLNEILSATPAILNLAIAGNMDLGRAADIASNIPTGFNMVRQERQKWRMF